MLQGLVALLMIGVSCVVALFAFSAFVVYGLPVIAIWLIVHLWNRHKEMKIKASIAENPGSYCDECLCQLAGNPKEYPHLYSCSHSTELHIGESRDEVVRRMQEAK